MNRIILVLLASIGTVTAEAQSMLRVQLRDNTPINISVDGRYFKKRGNSVTVNDLPRGRHYLQIYVIDGTRSDRPREEIVYEGFVRTYRDMATIFTYDSETQNADEQELDIDQFIRQHPPAGRQYREQDEMGDRRRNNIEEGNTYGNNQNNYPQSQPEVASPAPPEAQGTLRSEKLDQLQSKVSSKHTDTEKMNTIKDALSDETLSAEQVGVIMDWFSFESSKVEFAKWAYNKTVNKDAYRDLEPKLKYQEYRTELDNFLKAGR